MRAIDADALLVNLNIDVGDTTVGKRHYVMTWEIEEAPTLDVSERESGEWIDTSEGTFCSECDFKTNEYYNYCPNCGARMMGGDAE